MASVVCFCRDSDLVYRRVFSTWDDFESDYEKCMGTKNLGARNVVDANNEYNGCHYIT